MVNVLQLGLGQQGTTNMDKFQKLLEEDWPIRLVGISDLDPEKIKVVQERFPIAKTASAYQSAEDAIKSEIPRGVDAVFDATWTHQHTENIQKVIEVLRKSGERLRVYSIEDVLLGSVKIYPSEKPIFTSYLAGIGVAQELEQLGVQLTENAVEMFSLVKQVSINDIVRHQYDIVAMRAVRGGSVKEKCVKSKRNIYQHFAGAWADKNVHDIAKALATYEQRYGSLPDAQLESAEFDLFEGIAPNGQVFYYTKGGHVLTDIEGSADGIFTTPQAVTGERLNEAYSEVRFRLGNVPVWMVASWVPFKHHHRDLVESWLSDEMRIAIEEKAGKKGITLFPGTEDWNTETRAELIEAMSNDGRRVTYLTSTFGDFFTVKRADGEPAQVLHYGGGDFHKGYIIDALLVAMGKRKKPLITASNILYGSKILEEVEQHAYSDAFRARRRLTLDLRREPKELVDIITPSGYL